MTISRQSTHRRPSKVLRWMGSIALALAIVSTVTEAGGGGGGKYKDKNPEHRPDIHKMNGQVSPWPKYGEKPDTDTPEVKAWVKEVDWSKVPKLPIRKTESPGDPPECPEHVHESECWWTCTGCVAEDDVVDCPGQNAWGLTFDDGPEPGVTEKLLALLEEKNATATMFVTGMKSSRGPWLLKSILDKGHHLASHTWSHSGLTTLTNEEIVAELKWTEKYVFDHTGYKMKYFRPPYGDIDNRVRAIVRQLGYKTVIWTDGWDSQDWQLEEHSITAPQIVKMWKDDLNKFGHRHKGVITLEHDGDNRMINMARTLLEMGMKKGMEPQDIAQCLHDKVGYNEVPKTLPASTDDALGKLKPNAQPGQKTKSSTDDQHAKDKDQADKKKAEVPVTPVQEPKKQVAPPAEKNRQPPAKGAACSTTVSSTSVLAGGWTLAAILFALAF